MRKFWRAVVDAVKGGVEHELRQGPPLDPSLLWRVVRAVLRLDHPHWAFVLSVADEVLDDGVQPHEVPDEVGNVAADLPDKNDERCCRGAGPHRKPFLRFAHSKVISQKFAHSLCHFLPAELEMSISLYVIQNTFRIDIFFWVSSHVAIECLSFDRGEDSPA